MGKGVNHGLSGHPLYKKWGAIKTRCYNKNAPNYKWYGARGIKMCDEWINNPEKFIKYIEGLPTSGADGLTLDRIDNDGNYEEENLRWADHYTQCGNRRMGNGTFVGVYKSGGKYSSSVGYNNKSIYLGEFQSERKAVIARDMFIIKFNIGLSHLQILKKKD